MSCDLGVSLSMIGNCTSQGRLPDDLVVVGLLELFNRHDLPIDLISTPQNHSVGPFAYDIQYLILVHPPGG